MREIATVAAEIEPQLIEARRWFHQHPELSNREVDARRSLVVTVGSLHAGNRWNIIAGVTAAATLLTDFTATWSGD